MANDECLEKEKERERGRKEKVKWIINDDDNNKVITCDNKIVTKWEKL